MKCGEDFILYSHSQIAQQKQSPVFGIMAFGDRLTGFNSATQLTTCMVLGYALKSSL